MTAAGLPHAMTIDELLTVLDGAGLRLASGPPLRQLPLTSSTLYDRLMPPTGQRSGILLGIGVSPADPESAVILRSAARSGFAALVVKTLGRNVETLVAVADAEEIALLIVDDEIEWRQLEVLLASALSTATEATSSLSGIAVGDLFALANAIAAMTGGATAIEDLEERVLAYSTLPDQPIDSTRRDGILGRQVPDLPENADAYAALFRSTQALRLPGLSPGLRRLAVAVRAGVQPLGSIWVIDATGDLDPGAPQALERAADIAALHLLRARSAADLVRQQRAELLRRLLEVGTDSHLLAGQLGLDSGGHYIVLAVQPIFSAHQASVARTVPGPRLLNLVAMLSEAHNHGAESVLIGDRVYVLFSAVDGTSEVSVEALARKLQDRARTGLRVSVRASVGSSVEGARHISRSRRDADLVLLALASPAGELRVDGASPRTVGTARDLRSRLNLLELAQVLRDNPRLRSPHVLQIMHSDAETGTDYAMTLRTYLDCGRDSQLTAELLTVHTNTLRYRLRRAEELFGVDLTNADDTLTLWLGLRLLQFD